MSKLFFKKASLCFLVVFVVLQSCKKDKTTPPPVVVPSQSFSQSFDDMNAATTQGWVFQNLSDGPPYYANMKWKVAAHTLFYGDPPFDGTGLLYDNFGASNGGAGNLSDWVISPKVVFQNGDVITFYALSNGSNDGFGDRLQLRLNLFNTSEVIGETSSDVGNFTHPLVDINPLYSIDPTAGFPSTWTKYQATITGLNEPDSGRFAFRYFVELQGGANGDEIGLDKVSYISASH